MKYSKDQIENLQVAMIAMKEYKGRPDGFSGPLTRAAVKAILAELENPTVTPPVLLPTDPQLPGSGKFTEPVFVRVPGVKFKTHGYAKKTPEGLVVHYTVSGNNPENLVKYLAKQGYGCMVMAHDGRIYIPEGFDIFKQAAAHAGKSAWNGISGMNSHFMGMEICNWGSAGKQHVSADKLRVISKKTANQQPGTYEKYTPEIEASLINFCLWAKSKCPTFSFDNVAGHDEVALPAGRKNDPGGSLSMTMPAFREKLKAIAG